ncbi:LysR family transcriptional regulator [Glutamicibacter mishrai]|uniref:LysR family transcriptional regulator n=1 Tax=Glutamicibacter mishrai TaxID=1775880 RepID=UPI003F7909AA
MTINLGVSHLRCIVAVTEYGNFTAAADSLGLGQSSLSRTVAEAERRLNVRLFARSTRRVTLTEDGQQVGEYARNILAAFDDGLKDMEAFLTGERGTVAMACLPSIAASFLPPYLASFQRTHPNVHLVIKDGLLESALSDVRTGQVDFAIVATSGHISGMAQQPLGTDSFYCVVPQNHDWAGRESVNWSELTGQPFIQFGTDSSIAGPVQRALEDAQVELGRTVTAQNVAAVAGMVAAGIGITTVPELVLPMISFAGLAHITLRPVVQRRLSIVQLKNRRHSSCTKAFIERLVESESRDGSTMLGKAQSLSSP